MLYLISGFNLPRAQSSSTTQLLKRPASVREKSADGFKTSEWHRLHSRVWSRERKRLLDQGFADHIAKQRATEACKKAKKRFDAGEVSLNDFT